MQQHNYFDFTESEQNPSWYYVLVGHKWKKMVKRVCVLYIRDIIVDKTKIVIKSSKITTAFTKKYKQKSFILTWSIKINAEK